MEYLHINFTFPIKNSLDATVFTYEELADHIIDMMWDDLYHCGLEAPGNYTITIKEE